MSSHSLTYRLGFLSAVLAIVVGLAGCGGGTETSGGTETNAAQPPRRVSKAVAIKRGDAICAKVASEKEVKLTEYVKEHPESLKSHSSQVELVRSLSVPLLESELEELRASAPTAGLVQYKAIVSALEATIRKAETDPPSVAKPESGPLGEANKLAAKYGFKACSRFF